MADQKKTRVTTMVDCEELRSEKEIATDVLIEKVGSAAIVVLCGKDEPGIGTQGTGVHAHAFVARYAGHLGNIRQTFSAPLRAPHHTVSAMGILSELALSATGVLLLDDVDEFRREVLRTVLTTWTLMPSATRPVLVVTVRGKDFRHEELFTRLLFPMVTLQVA